MHSVESQPARLAYTRLADLERPETAGVPYLFPLAAGDRSTLLERLTGLEQAVQNAPSLPRLAAQSCADAQAQAGAAFALALVGRDRATLRQEIQAALKGVAHAFDSDQEWRTPAGSYFTANPLGRQGTLAFVYPGAFNAYVNLGRDLFHLFPQLRERFAGLTSNIGQAIAENRLYPRHVHSEADEKIAQAQLMNDLTAVISAGISFAVLFTMIMRDYFQARPQAAFGYSLGESSMLWALGVWRDGDRSQAAWQASPLMKTQLSGPKQTVRQAWNLGPYQAGQDDIWSTFILKAPIARVQARLIAEERVYLTIINTPEEVVIAGDPHGCRRVIKQLGCHALPATFDAVIHSSVMRSAYDEFARLYSLPVSPVGGIAFYSAADYAPVALEQEALAHAMAEVACQPVDFPRLVNRVYEDGARVFVELGAMSTCSRWIDRILKGKAHSAIAINRRQADDRTCLLGALARLIGQRVPLDLSPLYEPAGQASEDTSATGLFQHLDEHLRRISHEHAAFLQARGQALRQGGELIQLQLAAAQRLFDESPADLQAATVAHAAQMEAPPKRAPKPALFSEYHLGEFATGSIAKCFGPDYAIYQDRRAPRLPNGDLQLVNRIVEINGRQGELKPLSGLVSEYDVSAEAWFYRHNAYPAMPYSICMEIAMQPCGFLSAYLGTTLPFPELDLYFRNLDGHGRLLRDLDVRGKTIVNRVRLLSSTTAQGIIIQKFDFNLSCDDQPFYAGEAVFGYFTSQAMATQVGLDGGKESRPWLMTHQPPLQPGSAQHLNSRGWDRPDKPHYRLAQEQLSFLDEYQLVAGGGLYQQGYIYATRRINPRDWFFSCHFYQDPVMPGSLGVEAALQAMQIYALEQDLGRSFMSPGFALVPDHQVSWKYRGQITPNNQTMSLEVHIARIEQAGGGGPITIIGDVNLWKEGLRIYEVKQAAIRLIESA